MLESAVLKGKHMEENMPSEILKILREAGFEAYYVGGCVRDTFLNRPIHDWDITTSALPEEIMSCFEHCIPTGIRHGTVTVFVDHMQAEVTTYRTDGIYMDGRHPEQVRFVSSLAEDLGRRDFTINAMAMDQNGRIVDLYEGRNDLQNKVIRCVGEPEKRFREDALRMFRALRFSAQLGFSIEIETWNAISKCAALANALSTERVRDELEKTLLSDHPERIDDMVELGLLDSFGISLLESCRSMGTLPKDRSVRWAKLYQLCSELDLVRFRLDKATALNAMTAASLDTPVDRLGWKYLLSQYGVTITRIAAILNDRTALVDEILASGECFSLKDLAVNGKDFPDLQGKACGVHLKNLLMHVLSHPEDNDRKKLLKIK